MTHTTITFNVTLKKRWRWKKHRKNLLILSDKKNTTLTNDIAIAKQQREIEEEKNCNSLDVSMCISMTQIPERVCNCYHLSTACNAFDICGIRQMHTHTCSACDPTVSIKCIVFKMWRARYRMFERWINAENDFYRNC